jgi:hypothetical protein
MSGQVDASDEVRRRTADSMPRKGLLIFRVRKGPVPGQEPPGQEPPGQEPIEGKHVGQSLQVAIDERASAAQPF